MAAPAEYVALKSSMIRSGFSTDSPKAEPSVLKKKSKIEVLERRKNNDGVIRVRFAGGQAREVGVVG